VRKVSLRPRDQMRSERDRWGAVRVPSVLLAVVFKQDMVRPIAGERECGLFRERVAMAAMTDDVAIVGTKQ
jgi:hypothetical protein